MSVYTLRTDEVEQQELPGRSIRVFSQVLPVENMTFGICYVPPNSVMPSHNHMQEELIFILKGHGYVNVAGTEEPVEPGTLIHLPSGLEHFTANESDEEMQFTFCFSPPVVPGSYDDN